MVAKKFERCDSVITIEIDNKEYICDLSKDEVAVLFYDLANVLKRVEESMKDEESDIQKVKEVYCDVIDTFMYPNASKEIFVEDDSLSFHEDVFQYLLNEYKEYRERKAMKYSKARLYQK